MAVHESTLNSLQRAAIPNLVCLQSVERNEIAMFNPTPSSSPRTQPISVRTPTTLTLFDQFISTHTITAIHDTKKINQFLMDGFQDLQRQQGDSEALRLFVGHVGSFIDTLENHRGSPVRGMRFSARKEAFAVAISNVQNQPFDLVEDYMAIPHFKGKNHIVIDYAREKIEDAVRVRYPRQTGSQHPTFVRRLTTHQLGRVTQGDYILHVCGLFNLEKKLAMQNGLTLYVRSTMGVAAPFRRPVKPINGQGENTRT